MPGGGTIRFWREKLAGYKKYHQIVKTIKMVTLAKYRQTVVRTKIRDETLRYTRKVLDDVTVEEEDAIAKAEKLLYLPLMTNRGSCGALNSNMVRYLQEIESPKMSILSIGKKGMDTLSKVMPDVWERGIMNDMKQAMSFQFAAYVVDHIKSFEWDRCQIIFNRYHAASSQKLAVFNIPTFETWRARLEDESAGEGKIEEEGLLQSLPMKTALGEHEEGTLEDFYDFHTALAVLNAASENELSEYAARIIAVENQLGNITGLMQLADYTYNKTRKELITAELLEIIGTMTAMNAGKKSGLKKGEFWAEA
jgi:F-type H+-transporting ATPase subunit gamma|uniref:ATP synthase subunit gamma n=1 Tax=Eutreptiella gymnastica TaxID=73025 RepID=A0A7S4CEH2_9EUGL|mmetsp:Transcript_78679/g.131898  ORF Transcript_78679/g.131898 Transcript_78679/m.131898 type:complete len:309 (+) Transcript_78679:72-998(+)